MSVDYRFTSCKATKTKNKNKKKILFSEIFYVNIIFIQKMKKIKEKKMELYLWTHVRFLFSPLTKIHIHAKKYHLLPSPSNIHNKHNSINQNRKVFFCFVFWIEKFSLLKMKKQIIFCCYCSFDLFPFENSFGFGSFGKAMNWK